MAEPMRGVFEVLDGGGPTVTVRVRCPGCGEVVVSHGYGEDERDAEIARKRLAEIAANPAALVEGDELARRLAELDA